jgi:dipeptidyl aminopeptidase/acylaminoacyl peptidase
MPKAAPYGSWASPITAELIARGGVALNGLAASGGRLYWSELRPAEGGRSAVLVREPDGAARELTPSDVNVRTQVHEYGGGAWWVDGSTIYFTDWADQRLYRQDAGHEPVAITPEPEIPRGLRYTDGVLTKDRRAIVCVREWHHEDREATNEIVIFPVDGSVEPDDLVSGNDFYSNPRFSPDGTKLAWLEWSHPNLPWDGTFLFVGDVTPEYGLRNVQLVAGSMDESIFQPQWSPDGVLHFVSDRSGWWNIYRFAGGKVEPVVVMDADFGSPQWVFGQSTYTFVDGDIVCVYTRNATSYLGRIPAGGSTLEEIDTPFTAMSQVTAFGDRVALNVSSPTGFTAIAAIDPDTGAHEVLIRSRDDRVDPSYLSAPEAIDYESEGRVAHAFFYPPVNADVEAPSGEKPPLIVFSHGGPTGNVTSALNLNVQFWTSRGFAVVDVNYGGSTGYGRDYRRLLNGQWGVVDVEDSVNAARFLAARGDVDPQRLAIRGGSAGGFTTLAALVFTDVFKAGANYFGVSDFTPFVEDTHKFESRYLDTLVGPYPEKKDLYYERSPANFVERISVPVITFQGTEDAIVPPSQSERIVDALRANKIPCAYVTYEGEQHGFRKAENMIHSLQSELYFYGRVFGFDVADKIEPVEIENL